ncbi:uncharacterized protein BJ171DRAFT_494705 [Polychytrium aggregatum]|uniref:uncharacterized protein n=1 Tax=Polychytrium aggregatum TaxID=110093 RepID=UPI0022FF05F9|nr:uncharacterized protein BJ171DRAFT_494705 [Polychytrium aggregatum]KAI9207390.1 hypothetical protein BJ171DRAFT_494705 [Polychytrium aggregatum]
MPVLPVISRRMAPAPPASFVLLAAPLSLVPLCPPAQSHQLPFRCPTAATFHAFRPPGSSDLAGPALHQSPFLALPFSLPSRCSPLSLGLLSFRGIILDFLTTTLPLGPPRSICLSSFNTASS